MEGKKLCKTLPDHLVERIIAMIPFPAIFRARCLSKSWHSRFSSIESQDDGAMKRTASVFQKMVTRESKNWETFCPVLVGSNGDLVAYDQRTNSWRKLPSVSFLPKTLLTRQLDLQIEGALLYASVFEHSEEIYVANILTRTWKRLPLPPMCGCPVYSFQLVVSDKSLETYKVFLICQQDLYDSDFVFVQIYDSKPGSWSSMNLNFLSWSGSPYDDVAPWCSSALLDGIIYIASSEMDRTLLALNVKQGTVKPLMLSVECRKPVMCWRELVVCKDRLLMIFSEDGVSTSVLNIDLDSLTVVDLDSNPSPLVSLQFSSRMEQVVGDEHHIFFGYVIACGSRMRAYNIKENRWSASFAPPTSSDKCQYKWITSFQPGFGPFATV